MHELFRLRGQFYSFTQDKGEVQLRMTPDDSRFYSSWLEEGEDGSDIIFRRIMSPAFPANITVVE